jgi:hypothetical protein
LRTTLPPITVTAQKAPEDPLRRAGQRHRGHGETLDSADRERQRRGRLRAEHLLQRVHRAQS